MLPLQKGDLLIRSYEEPDEASLVELWNACRLTAPHNDPHEDIWLKRQIQPDLLLIGEHDGRIAATVMVGYDGHRGWINYMGVHPDFQSRGFGRSMMETAEDLLRRLGCPKINLQVRVGNDAVVGFYEQLGYQVEARISMGKRLPCTPGPLMIESSE